MHQHIHQNAHINLAAQAFADFEKFHPTKPCFGGYRRLLPDKPFLEIYLHDVFVLRCFTVFRLHCYASLSPAVDSSVQLRKPSSDYQCIFRWCSILQIVSRRLVEQDRCNRPLCQLPILDPNCTKNVYFLLLFSDDVFAKRSSCETLYINLVSL